MSSVSIASEYRSELSDLNKNPEEGIDFYHKSLLPKKRVILDSAQKATTDSEKNSNKTDSDYPIMK
jgi:hypothetical protein